VKHPLRTRLGATSFTVAVMVALMALVAAPVFAANQASTPVSNGGVTPYIIDGANSGGNRTCAEVGAAFDTTFEHSSGKRDYPSQTGTWPTGLSVTITDGTFVSFTSTFLIGAVIVKGSNDANVYYYGSGSFGDSGLASPPAGDGPAGLSNLTFCWNASVPGAQAELTVSKTANTSWKRTHAWSIEKTVDPDEVWLYLPGGAGSDSATVDYTVTVTYNGYTDSDFTVSGNIEIENTGEVTAEITDITDTVATGITATIDCGSQSMWLDPEDKITCTYTAQLSGPDNGINQVDVTADFWDGGGKFAEDEVFSDSEPYTFSATPTTELHASVDVYDDPEDAAKNKLGTLNASSYIAGDEIPFQYTKTFTHPGAQSCQDYVFDNEASVESGSTVLDSDTAAVDVHLQCLVRQGETATGEGPRWPGTSNWFMYTTRADILDGGANLIAGQHINVGTVTQTANGCSNGKVKLVFTLTDGWQFAGTESIKVHPMTAAPTSYRQPGQFQHKYNATGSTASTGCIANTAFYGIHLDVFKMVPDPNFGP
jgi:hypothetical protein